MRIEQGMKALTEYRVDDATNTAFTIPVSLFVDAFAHSASLHYNCTKMRRIEAGVSGGP